MSCRPFIKWAGGKRLLVPKLLPHLAPTFRDYYEPFLGGGALFFHLSPERAVLGDMNRRLIRTYRAVRDDIDVVLRDLRALMPGDRIPTEAEYRAVRDASPDGGTDNDVAAWFIFCNRLGFNGLYRVNKSGKFNVPYGKPKRPPQVDEDNLRACSKALARAELNVFDFGETMSGAGEGSLVYCDPPYDPIDSNKYGFIAYTADGFGPAEQARLRDAARAAATRGAHVVISNAMTSRVRELYAVGFDLRTIQAPRRINCDPSGRGMVDEAVAMARPIRPQAQAPLPLDLEVAT